MEHNTEKITVKKYVNIYSLAYSQGKDGVLSAMMEEATPPPLTPFIFRLVRKKADVAGFVQSFFINFAHPDHRNFLRSR